jgi:hypothetical protein
MRWLVAICAVAVTFGVSGAQAVAGNGGAHAAAADGGPGENAGAADAPLRTGSGLMAGAAANQSRAERRCRSLARRRLARTKPHTTARLRMRRKLRRCLRAARRDPVGKPTPPADTPDRPATDDPGAPPGTPLPSFVGVIASDTDGFRLALSRPAVAAGTVTIELRNTDSGPHDLAIRPDGGGADVAQFDSVEPGALRRQPVSLAKGRWYLYCTLEGHEPAGMHATLRAE